MGILKQFNFIIIIFILKCKHANKMFDVVNLLRLLTTENDLQK